MPTAKILYAEEITDPVRTIEAGIHTVEFYQADGRHADYVADVMQTIGEKIIDGFKLLAQAGVTVPATPEMPAMESILRNPRDAAVFVRTARDAVRSVFGYAQRLLPSRALWLTQSEAAKTYGIPPMSISRAVGDGTLAHLKQRNVKFVLRSQVESWRRRQIKKAKARRTPKIRNPMASRRPLLTQELLEHCRGIAGTSVNRPGRNRRSLALAEMANRLRYLDSVIARLEADGRQTSYFNSERYGIAWCLLEAAERYPHIFKGASAPEGIRHVEGETSEAKEPDGEDHKIRPVWNYQITQRAFK